MAFYNKEKRGSYDGPRNFEKRGPKERDFGGGGRGFSGRNSGRSEMFEATCSECHRDCQVPFRPNGRKPVLCSTCFGKQGGMSQDRGRGDRSFGRPSFGDRDDRRSHGPREFSGNRPQSQNTENFKEQFTLLNAKLDRVIDLLERAVPPSKNENLDLDIEEIAEEMPLAKVKKAKKKKKE